MSRALADLSELDNGIRDGIQWPDTSLRFLTRKSAWHGDGDDTLYRR